MQVDVVVGLYCENMAHSSTSSSQRVGSMAGSGALSHVYIQYPPFRCNVPGSLGMMYDDGTRLLLVPSSNKVKFSKRFFLNSFLDCDIDVVRGICPH